MITDNLTCLPETLPRVAAKPRTQNPIGLLTQIYREAGLPLEVARRFALADFRCSFPQYLEGGV